MKRIAKADALARIADGAGGADGCTMCRLASTAAPLASSPHAIAILDRYAARPGHVMVIARRHEERVTALAWDEYAELQRLAWQVARALDATLVPRPRRIYIAALGSAAPLAMSFPHVHLHVIPLADGADGDRPAEVFTWVDGVYVFDGADEEAALHAQLRAALHLIGRADPEQ